MSEPGHWSQPEQPVPPAQPVQPGGGWGPPPASPAGSPQAYGGWAKPGIIPLRPLRLGEIYDGAFSAVRSNPMAILGWAVVVVVISVTISTLTSGLLERGLLTTLSSPTLSSSGEFSEADLRKLARDLGASAPGASIALLISTLVQLVSRALLSGVVTVAVSSAVLGRRLSAGALGERVRPRLLPLIGLSVLTSLVSLVIFAAALVPGGALLGLALARGDNDLIVPGALLLVAGVVVGLFAWALVEVRWLLAPPALVLEPQPVFAAMRRSWALSRQAFWRLLGIELLTSIGLGIAASLISTPFSLVGGLLSGALGDGDAGLAATLVLSGVGSAIASTIVLPLGAAVVALLYIDQRMRREGLDVELAQAAAQPA